MKKKWVVFGIIFLILLAGMNVAKTIYKDNQASGAFLLNVVLQGEYKAADGVWQPIVQGEHIPANKGEVVFRGRLQKAFPDGEIVAPVLKGDQMILYLNHIGCSVYINGEEAFVFEAENPSIGNPSCGRHWYVYNYTGTESDTIEFHLSNPHKFGNAFAMDEFLNSMSMYDANYFEQAKDKKVENIRTMGFGIVFAALSILGIALFSSLIHLDLSKIIWFAGAAIFFAGVYFIADATNFYTWNMQISLQTTLYVLSIMLYGFFMQGLTNICFEKTLKQAGDRLFTVSGLFTGGLLVYALVSNMKLYDVLGMWAVLQTVTTVVFLVFSCFNINYLKGQMRLVQMMFIVSLISILLDIFAARFAWWNGCSCSSIVFIIQFLAALFTVFLIFPKSIRAALREKEIQAELEKSKTAVMFSQIQPHFLYNSLGAIRELCRQDPEDARDALGTFITYLRGNMDSIQREHTIHFSKELNHISAYLELEKLRFEDDLSIVFDIQETDFFIPSLTIQPLVENAVKHGICGREDGGTITLHTHREGADVIVQIKDDGVGFDVSDLETIEHVGLKNVRNRLQHIVNGKLEVESTPGVGTTVTITINDGEDLGK